MIEVQFSPAEKALSPYDGSVTSGHHSANLLETARCKNTKEKRDRR